VAPGPLALATPFEARPQRSSVAAAVLASALLHGVLVAAWTGTAGSDRPERTIAVTFGFPGDRLAPDGMLPARARAARVAATASRGTPAIADSAAAGAGSTPGSGGPEHARWQRVPGGAVDVGTREPDATIAAALAEYELRVSVVASVALTARGVWSRCPGSAPLSAIVGLDSAGRISEAILVAFAPSEVCNGDVLRALRGIALPLPPPVLWEAIAREGIALALRR
jgi:hypothetical protein